MSCVSLATNASLISPQMPAGYAHNLMGWINHAAAAPFANVFLSETATADTTAGDLGSGLDVPYTWLVSKFDARVDGLAANIGQWLFYVLSSKDGGINHRLRVFLDDVGLTKVSDVTRAYTGNEKRYASLIAANGLTKVTAWAAHSGASLSDAECRAQAYLRTASTPSAGAMWATWPLRDSSDVSDSLGGNNFTAAGTQTTTADEPKALSARAGRVIDYTAFPMDSLARDAQGLQ